jgi:hypothetical protein
MLIHSFGIWLMGCTGDRKCNTKISQTQIGDPQWLVVNEKRSNLPVDHHLDYRINLIVFILGENVNKFEGCTILKRFSYKFGNPKWPPGISFQMKIKHFKCFCKF